MSDVSRWITEAPLDLDALIAETEDVTCGALVAFGGLVRNHNDGRNVSGMTYDAHARMAAATLEALEAEALRRFDVQQCRLVHRVGPLALGEASVWVVVRSPHRKAAFRAAEYAIDTLKETLPVWKEEHYTDGESAHLDGTSIAPDDTDA